MAASSGVSAFGSCLVWDYDKILEILNITGPSQTRDTVEVTHHGSDDGYREFIAGMISGGEIALEGNLIPGDSMGQIGLLTDLQAGTTRTAYLVMPMAVGQAMVLSAIPTGYAPSAPHDGKLSASLGITVTGKPTLLTTQSDGISALTGIEETGAAALSFNEAVAAGTYKYTCTVDTASTWVKITVTAASHTIYVQGGLEATGVQTDELTLGAAGTVTRIFIFVFEADESPRLYEIEVTRP